jgi:hypothetical protein
MDSLFCLNTGFTSNDRNSVKKTFIFNVHTLYFYLHKGCSPKRLRVAIDSFPFSGFLLSKHLLSKVMLSKLMLLKQGSARNPYATYPRRYFLCLPFW